MLRILVGGIATAALVCSVAGQELGTNVFVSEDELIEAFAAGELDLPEYLALREMLWLGVDSAATGTMDYVPNAASFPGLPVRKAPSVTLNEGTGFLTTLEEEQRRPFVRSDFDGSLRYRFRAPLEGDGGEYHLSVQTRWRERWRAVMNVARDGLGQERVVARSLSYRDDRHLFREVRLGSYARRLGLGLGLGYRGKVLSSSERIDGESWLHPDYGGHNGVYARLVAGRTELRAASSHRRDGRHRLDTWAAMMSVRCGNLSPGLILATTTARRRGGGAVVVDHKAAVHLSGRYEGGKAVAEAAWQMGARPGFAAAVLEGRHRFRGAEIRYAGWRYEDRFLDLSSGSKAANLARTVTLSEIDLSYADRRSGQTGGLAKTIVTPADRWQLVGSVLHAVRGDARSLDLMQAVIGHFGTATELRADHLVRGRRRETPPGSGYVWTGRTRLEYRWRPAGAYLRAYAAYESGDAGDNRWAFFANVRVSVPGGGEIELWGHAARVDPLGPVLERGYGFLQVSHPVFAETRLALKVTLSYSRSATRRHSQSFVLVLEAPL